MLLDRVAFSGRRLLLSAAIILDRWRATVFGQTRHRCEASGTRWPFGRRSRGARRDRDSGCPSRSVAADSSRRRRSQQKPYRRGIEYASREAPTPADAMRRLNKLPWPGNVAQLRQVIAETVARQTFRRYRCRQAAARVSITWPANTNEDRRPYDRQEPIRHMGRDAYLRLGYAAHETSLDARQRNFALDDRAEDFIYRFREGTDQRQ